MKLGQGCRTRTPWWCWIVFLLVAALTLPGGVIVTAKERKNRLKSRPSLPTPRLAVPQHSAAKTSTTAPTAKVVPRLAIPQSPLSVPENTLLVQLTVLSGRPQAIEALHANWNVLPAEIPQGQSLAEALRQPTTLQL